MPRVARIDTPCLLHHVMIRGIERRKIFSDDKDREGIIDLRILATELAITPAVVGSAAVQRGEKMAREGDYGLETRDN